VNTGVLFLAAHIHVDFADENQGESRRTWNVAAMKSGQQVHLQSWCLHYLPASVFKETVV